MFILGIYSPDFGGRLHIWKEDSLLLGETTYSIMAGDSLFCRETPYFWPSLPNLEQNDLILEGDFLIVAAESFFSLIFETESEHFCLPFLSYNQINLFDRTVIIITKKTKKQNKNYYITLYSNIFRFCNMKMLKNQNKISHFEYDHSTNLLDRYSCSGEVKVTLPGDTEGDLAEK